MSADSPAFAKTGQPWSCPSSFLRTGKYDQLHMQAGDCLSFWWVGLRQNAYMCDKEIAEGQMESRGTRVVRVQVKGHLDLLWTALKEIS